LNEKGDLKLGLTSKSIWNGEEVTITVDMTKRNARILM
jgi:hypothetical protein